MKIKLNAGNALFSLGVILYFIVSNFTFKNDWFKFIDLHIVDALQNVFSLKERNQDIVIAAVDTESIDKIGRWPWSRDKIAELVHILNEHYEVKSIGFDMVFSEKDKNFVFLKDKLEELRSKAISETGEKYLTEEQLEEALRSGNTDAQLSAELAKWKNIVMGYVFFSETIDISHLDFETIKNSAKNIFDSNMLIDSPAGAFTDEVEEATFLESNIPEFLNSASMNGFFNIVSEDDGVVRKVPLLLKFNGQYYQSLDLMLFRHYMGFDGELGTLGLIFDQNGLDSMTVNGESYPLNSDGSIWVNYKGEEKTFPHYSVSDLLSKSVEKERLKGKVVYLGVTEIGVFDVRTTPVGNTYPGVEVHANVLDNLILRQYLQNDDLNLLISLILLILFTVVILFIQKKTGMTASVILLLAIWAIYIGLNIWLFFQVHTWYNFYAVGFLFFGNIFINLFNKYYVEGREKKFIKNTFARYLSPVVIEEIINEPDMIRLGGEKKNISILFSDIVGFTSISEGLQVEELIELLNQYLSKMTDLVFLNQGTIDKYIGDAILAFYGAPVIIENHASKSVSTAIEMIECVKSEGIGWKEKYGHQMACRIGINTGNAIVGNVGSTQRMDYTVIGDSVNLASRLESANKHFGTTILISEETWKGLSDPVEGRPVDVIRVIGKKEPVQIFEVQAKKGGLPTEQKNRLDSFNEAYQLYRARKWEKSLEIFGALHMENQNDIVTKIFAQRCKAFSKTPPGDDWDGVFTMKNK